MAQRAGTVVVELSRGAGSAGGTFARGRGRPAVDMLTRIAKMSLGEFGWRSRASAQIAWDRIRAAHATPAWNRPALSAALAPHAALDDVRSSLDHGQWLLAHRRLARHFASGPQR